MAKSTIGPVVSADPAYTFTVTGDRTLTAVFELIKYTITAAIDPSGSGTVTGAGEYQEGATVTLTATAGDGYEFSGWQEDGTTVSTNATYTFTATGDRTLVAVFAVKAPPRLPAEYQEVEYVDFDGTSRIDNAIPEAFSYFGFELDVELLPTTVNGMLVGQYGYYQVKSGTTTYNTYSSYSVAVSGDEIFVEAYCAKVRQGYGFTAAKLALPKQSGKMNISWDKGSGTLSVNDVSGTYSPTYSNYIVVRNAQIGCRSRYTYIPAQNLQNLTYENHTPFRFYEMKTFYTGNVADTPTKADLYNHLIPCYRKSDNVAGLYDIQKNVFRIPIGGALIAGPAV